MTARIDGGDPQGVVFHPDQLDEDANIIVWAKDIMDILHRFYPGWGWAIEPDPRGRVIKITCEAISHEWGYIINLMQTPIEDARVRQQVVLRAGGEYLERFGIRPGPATKEAYDRRYRYPWGATRADLSDKPACVQKLQRDRAIDKGLREGSLNLAVEDRGGQRHVWIK